MKPEINIFLASFIRGIMDNKSFSIMKQEFYNAAFGINDKCYLLIDASLEYYRSDNFVRDLIKNNDAHLICSHRNELHDALPLYLISFDVHNVKDVEYFDKSIRYAINELKPERIEAGEGRSICAWISTALTKEQLSDFISRMMVQTFPSGEDVLIRYFDPSVFGLLFCVFDNWQKQQLLSGINTWCYIDSNGEYQVKNGNGDSIKKLNYSLALSESDVSDINNIRVINAILLIYRKAHDSKEINEKQVTELLYPALRYFYSHFTAIDNDVIEFGLDVLKARRLFYLQGIFERYTLGSDKKKLTDYVNIKSRIANLEWQKAISST
jgi:hypothetical protein